MHTPLISILTPVYNAEKYLSETIRSVLNQTYKNFEYILVNDGSTDSSLEIINSYNDRRIKVFTIDNSGQCAASNYALKQSKGEYIKFVDADDILSPNHIATQVVTINSSQTALAFCEWGRFYSNNYLDTVFEKQPYWKDMKPLEWLKTNLDNPNSDMLAAWQWLIPRSIIEQTGGWNEKLSLNNDFEFGVRLVLAAQNMVFAKGAKLYYRSGQDGSLSLTLSKKAIEAALLTTQIGCKQLLEAENSKEMRQICADRYQVWIYRFYPKYKNLVKLFEIEVQKMGGSFLKIQGGRVLLSLCKIIGWKRAKSIQYLFYKIGWNYIAKIKKNFYRL